MQDRWKILSQKAKHDCAAFQRVITDADVCRCFSAVSADSLGVDEADYQLPDVYDRLHQKKSLPLPPFFCDGSRASLT